MCEYGGDIHFILYVLKLKIWLRSDPVSKSSSLRHGHCLATIAFIIDQGCQTYGPLRGCIRPARWFCEI